MCTVVVLRRPGHDWPLLLAANRDELRSRPSRPPARHWPDRPEVVAGLDLEAEGSWLGINDHGLVACVLNRTGTLGPQPGRRSRGELVLEALDHAEASAAAGALADLHPDAYRPFNLLVADPRDCYWLRHGGDGEIRVHPVPDGLHMLTATELDDVTQPRIARFLPAFRAAAEPQPSADGGDWQDWIALLGQRAADDMSAAERQNAMNLDGIEVQGEPYGTVASSLVAIPAYPGFDALPVFLHADGPPDRVPFERIAVAAGDAAETEDE
ncbi:MAG: NRDE family protein [Thiohalocapsa sp.]|jgi:uncharacterized protein with NRDE domain|uniref:NRDE family protein n=1 Tax=Thiohalocapsa sp. TaxID=2497641 RepID=UPI0025ECC7B8|nr:NRDE family protein [Thiohalocapsa sp.]MCG6942029.1 NRDE family protein [Thiohalocapsa sp.]